MSYIKDRIREHYEETLEEMREDEMFWGLEEWQLKEILNELLEDDD